MPGGDPGGRRARGQEGRREGREGRKEAGREGGKQEAEGRGSREEVVKGSTDRKNGSHSLRSFGPGGPNREREPGVLAFKECMH